MMHDYYYPMYWTSYSWLGSLIGLAVFGLIIFLLVSALTHHSSESAFDPKSKSALNILKKRYARGKITKKEYDEMKKVIEE